MLPVSRFRLKPDRVNPEERRMSMKLKVGQRAPNFTLPSHLDRKVTLAQCLGKGPVVIAFFPLAWTPV